MALVRQAFVFLSPNKYIFKILKCICTIYASHFFPEPRKYETFLESRPDQMELEAIKLVCELCLKYR